MSAKQPTRMVLHADPLAVLAMPCETPTCPAFLDVATIRRKVPKKDDTGNWYSEDNYRSMQENAVKAAMQRIRGVQCNTGVPNRVHLGRAVLALGGPDYMRADVGQSRRRIKPFVAPIKGA